MKPLPPEDYQEPACPFTPPPSRIYHEPSERIPLADVIAECDRLFNAERTRELGEHLRKWRARAVELGDKKAELSILNELMGHYRMAGDYERGMAALRDGIRLISEVGISGSVSAGTILLNAATVLKAFGEVQEALRYYAEASRCYGAHLPPEDPQWAGLFNNMAAAYLDNGEPKHSEAYYRKALAILKQTGNLMDTAVTWVNLAQLYATLPGEDAKVTECLDQAFACFESPEAEYGGYYAHTCRKCAGAFGALGQPEREDELNARAEALYEGT